MTEQYMSSQPTFIGAETTSPQSGNTSFSNSSIDASSSTDTGSPKTITPDTTPESTPPTTPTQADLSSLSTPAVAKLDLSESKEDSEFEQCIKAISTSLEEAIAHGIGRELFLEDLRKAFIPEHGLLLISLKNLETKFGTEKVTGKKSLEDGDVWLIRGFKDLFLLVPDENVVSHLKDARSMFSSILDKFDYSKIEESIKKYNEEMQRFYAKYNFSSADLTEVFGFWGAVKEEVSILLKQDAYMRFQKEMQSILSNKTGDKYLKLKTQFTLYKPYLKLKTAMIVCMDTYERELVGVELGKHFRHPTFYITLKNFITRPKDNLDEESLKLNCEFINETLAKENNNSDLSAEVKERLQHVKSISLEFLGVIKDIQHARIAPLLTQLERIEKQSKSRHSPPANSPTASVAAGSGLPAHPRKPAGDNGHRTHLQPIDQPIPLAPLYKHHSSNSGTHSPGGNRHTFIASSLQAGEIPPFSPDARTRSGSVRTPTPTHGRSASRMGTDDMRTQSSPKISDGL